MVSVRFLPHTLVDFLDDPGTLSVNCSCRLPCTRVIYEPRLSSCLLSTFNVDRIGLLDPAKKNRTKYQFLHAREISQKAIKEIAAVDRTQFENVINATQAFAEILYKYSMILANASTLTSKLGISNILTGEMRPLFADTRFAYDSPIIHDKRKYIHGIREPPSIFILENLIGQFLKYLNYTYLSKDSYSELKMNIRKCVRNGEVPLREQPPLGDDDMCNKEASPDKFWGRPEVPRKKRYATNGSETGGTTPGYTNAPSFRTTLQNYTRYGATTSKDVSNSTSYDKGSASHSSGGSSPDDSASYDGYSGDLDGGYSGSSSYYSGDDYTEISGDPSESSSSDFGGPSEYHHDSSSASGASGATDIPTTTVDRTTSTGSSSHYSGDDYTEISGDPSESSWSDSGGPSEYHHDSSSASGASGATDTPTTTVDRTTSHIGTYSTTTTPPPSDSITSNTPSDISETMKTSDVMSTITRSPTTMVTQEEVSRTSQTMPSSAATHQWSTVSSTVDPSSSLKTCHVVMLPPEQACPTTARSRPPPPPPPPSFFPGLKPHSTPKKPTGPVDHESGTKEEEDEDDLSWMKNYEGSESENGPEMDIKPAPADYGLCERIIYNLCALKTTPLDPVRKTVEELDLFPEYYGKTVRSLYRETGKDYSNIGFHKECLTILAKIPVLLKQFREVFNAISLFQDSYTIGEALEVLNMIHEKYSHLADDILTQLNTIKLGECMWFKRYWKEGGNGMSKAENVIRKKIGPVTEAPSNLEVIGNKIPSLSTELITMSKLTQKVVPIFQHLISYLDNEMTKTALAESFDGLLIQNVLADLTSRGVDFRASGQVILEEIELVKRSMVRWYQSILDELLVPLLDKKSIECLPLVDAAKNSTSSKIQNMIHNIKKNTKSNLPEIIKGMLTPLSLAIGEARDNIKFTFIQLVLDVQICQANLDTFLKGNEMSSTFFT